MEIQMNLLTLIEADGGTLRKAATTNGGEWCGPCPFCGGNDRFRVWPNEEGGRYWCRGCGKAGDAIQYLRDKRGFSFSEACRVVGWGPDREILAERPARPARPAAWEPKEATAPPAVWHEAARVFLDGAVSCLWSDRGEAMRAWLREKKGLHDATIRKAGLGLSLANSFEPRASWGLETAFREDGTERRQWIPAGLVIPWIVNGAVQRLRVRRDNANDGKRYVIVSGSCAGPMTWNLERSAAVVIVESELDGLLITQQAGDLCAVVALGNAQAKPDRFTHEALKRAVCVLVSLDTGTAGARASWAFWPGTYGGKMKRWPTVQGKDASDARLAGLDLRQWVIAGVFGSETRFERFCIQTIDGGMTDREAMEGIGNV